MADFPNFDTIMNHRYETLTSDYQITALESDERRQDLGTMIDVDEVDDDVIRVPDCKFVRSGFKISESRDCIVVFVNAGGEEIKSAVSTLRIESDVYFHGGDVLRTDETIANGGDLPSIYQSARFGNFSYRFDNIAPGHYLIDLHFVEIINTNGPKGMRVFDVFVQDEKVLSQLDIFSVVGANKPLQLVGVSVCVDKDEAIVIRFQGFNGCPTVSGICIKEAPNLPAPEVATGVEISTVQDRVTRMKFIDKYEKKIEELSRQFQLKTDECHEAWMSLAAANDQLEKIRMELDNKSFQNHHLDQVKDKQAASLEDALRRHEKDKKFWDTAINNLEHQIKAMEQEYLQLSREAHNCAASVPDLDNMVFAVQAMVSQYEDLKYKYIEEQTKRKILYNQVQEAKGNIRVFCRCRPFSKSEQLNGSLRIVEFDAAKDGDLGILTGASTKKIFKFDRVYTPEDDQVDVFEDASPVVISVLDGYNVCIFAYGQTGTGKTFTMEGIERNRGVNYRTLEQLFKTSEERKDSFTYNISVSVLEVYNEQIRDLLASAPTSKKLEIRQVSEGVHHVPGIIEAKVENIYEVWDVLQTGSNARAVGSNNVNEHSSRSHCLLCIMIRAKNLATGECTMSKLWLVDLAGSERLTKTDVRGDRLKEAQNINKSLSALGDVISALATKSNHIPYRNSKLTHLLQDSLGGNSKTLMFVQISPAEEDLSETISSLNFATRVRGVELGPAKKQIDTAELQKLKNMLEKAKQESRSKDEALKKLEENLQNIESKAKAKDQTSRIYQDKINELEDNLDLKTDLCKQLEKQLLQVKEAAKGKEESVLTLQQRVKELENKLKASEHLDSLNLPCKVKDLENKLKERTQEFDLHSYSLQQKVKELENKLKMQEEIAERLRLREQQTNHVSPLCSSLKAVTSHPTTHDEKENRLIPEISLSNMDIQEHGTLKSRHHQDSDLLKGPESLRNVRRKSETQTKAAAENRFSLSSNSSSGFEKKTSLLPGDTNKGGVRIDPAKAFTRVTRSVKSLNSNTNKRPFSLNKIVGRDDQAVQGAKEKGISRTRLWHG